MTFLLQPIPRPVVIQRPLRTVRSSIYRYREYLRSRRAGACSYGNHAALFREPIIVGLSFHFGKSDIEPTIYNTSQDGFPRADAGRYQRRISARNRSCKFSLLLLLQGLYEPYAIKYCFENVSP